MFSPAFITQLESACVHSLETLVDLLHNAERDNARITAGLGILRLAERIFAKLPLPEVRGGGGRGEGSKSATRPAPAPTSDPIVTATAEAEPASPPQPSDRPDPSSRPAPLTKSEMAELKEYYGVSPHILKSPRHLPYWRARLNDGRYYPQKHKADAEAAAQEAADAIAAHGESPSPSSISSA